MLHVAGWKSGVSRRRKAAQRSTTNPHHRDTETRRAASLAANQREITQIANYETVRGKHKNMDYEQLYPGFEQAFDVGFDNDGVFHMLTNSPDGRVQIEITMHPRLAEKLGEFLA